MIVTLKIYSQDKEIEFAIKKYAMLIIKWEKENQREE